MRSLHICLLLVTMTTSALLGISATSQNSAPVAASLKAPTYYIATSVYDCESDPAFISFRGASNLPTAAILNASVMDTATGEEYSVRSQVVVDEAGFFAARLFAQKGKRFRNGLTLIASFDANLPKQAASVLQVVGPKGQHLADVPRATLRVPGEFDRTAINPQLTQHSGDYLGLSAAAVVSGCASP